MLSALNALQSKLIRPISKIRSVLVCDAKSSRSCTTSSSAPSSVAPSLAPRLTQSVCKTDISWKVRADEFLLKQRTLSFPRWVTPRHYTFNITECCGHSSFMLVAISYAVNDFVMLRILAVAGSSVMLVITYFHPFGRILWLPFNWNVLVIVLNSYRIGKVYWDRYQADKLPLEILRVRNEHFNVVNPVEFAKLVRSGYLESFRDGEIIVSQSEHNRYVRLILVGELRVLRDGKLTYRLHEGSFVSESGLHAGIAIGGKVESCSTIVADGPVQVLRWDRSELMDLLRRDNDLCRSLKAVLSWDVVRKLISQHDLIPDGIITDPEEWTKRCQQQSHHRYLGILRNVLAHPDFFKNHKAELNNYRVIHDIGDECHRISLKQCGWTPEEFERGLKDSAPEEVGTAEDDIRHDWKWFLHDLYERLFG